MDQGTRARKKAPAKAAPTDGHALGPEVERLLQRIEQDLPSLSPALQTIGQYMLRNHDRLALEKIHGLAANCAVHASAIVRFAKHFGYSGYSELQQVFRDGMSERIAHLRDYQDRIREVIRHSDEPLSTGDIAQSYIEGSIAGMQDLQRQLQRSGALAQAVKLLLGAPNIWVIGTNRAFPIATYLAYSLQHTDKPVHLITGVGSMLEGELRSLRTGDVMIATSFAPYGPHTLRAVEVARARGLKVISICDSRVGELGRQSDVILEVAESSVFGFRSLTNSMVMAQSLFVALAYALELQYAPLPNQG